MRVESLALPETFAMKYREVSFPEEGLAPVTSESLRTAELLAVVDTTVAVVPLGRVTWAPVPTVVESAEVALGTNKLPVAVKVSGDPESPVAEAVMVFDPPVLPKVQLPTIAIPFASVVWLAPLSEPPPLATEKVTRTPLTTLLFASVTRTLGGMETEVAASAT
jgi:hypothetical protein